MILMSLVLLPLLGAIFLFWAQRREDIPVWNAGIAILGLTSVLWLASRGGLNQPVALLSDSYEALGLPAWAWQLDETRWWLAGYWLALVLLVVLGNWGRTTFIPVTLLLTFAGLLITAGHSVTAFLGGLMLASLVWLTVGYAVNEAVSGFLLGQRLLVWWLTIGLALFLFLPAGATQPVILAVAALPVLGVFPFHYWREREWSESAGVAPLLYGLPALVAMRLFLEQPTFAIEAGAAWLAPWGVVALTVVAITAWTGRGRISSRMALLGCSAVFTWLAGTFGGAAAAMAEGRGLLIAGAAMFILPRIPISAAWQRIPYWVVAASMAGLPLTAGGFGRGLLYEGLLRANMAGAWVLLSLLSTLPISLWIWWASGDSDIETTLPDERHNPLRQVVPWLFVVALLPSIGQIVELSTISLNGWLALLLPVVTASVLVYVRGQRPTFGWNPEQLRRGWHSFQGQLSEAGGVLRQTVAEAGRILEGEGGLLWILFLAVIFGLARL